MKIFGFLHRYYRRLEDVDNDFYFRIGLYDSASIPESKQRIIEQSIRQFLGDLEPVIIEIGLSDISLVFSDKETLPMDSTKVLPVSNPDVTADLIMHHYDSKNPKGG